MRDSSSWHKRIRNGVRFANLGGLGTTKRVLRGRTKGFLGGKTKKFFRRYGSCLILYDLVCIRPTRSFSYQKSGLTVSISIPIWLTGNIDSAPDLLTRQVRVELALMVGLHQLESLLGFKANSPRWHNSHAWPNAICANRLSDHASHAPAAAAADADAAINFTLSHKTSLSYFFNNAVKNKQILIIFGEGNPEDIWHNHLCICPPNFENVTTIPC